MRIRILPYKQGSRSAKALATALGGKVLRLENSKYKRKPDDVIINWGNSLPPHTPTLGNDPFWVKHATNKLCFFDRMWSQSVSIPRYWGYDEADSIPDDAFPIVCRTVLSGHSGEGIVISRSRDELVPAPLYVEYKKKKDEYRVHCGRSEVEIRIISLQRKARRLDHANPNWEIRNHGNGFVYVRGNVDPPVCVKEAAVEAFTASCLDFGAVDVIYNAHEDKAYVLEINTAPGLEGQTALDYRDYFLERINT